MSAAGAHCPISEVTEIGVLGGGVIGAGWAALFAARGYQVRVYDPDPDCGRQFWPLIANAGTALADIYPGAGPLSDRILLSSEFEKALTGVQFVQECAPDRAPLKRQLLREAEAVLESSVIFASSTSGLPMSELQAGAQYPERMLVGHPFNPPYLIPLVEVLGGVGTSPAAIDWTVEFYRSIGKKPIVLDREVPGFVANRLQEAMWREALHMIVAEEATVQQIDASIAYGPGLRWALMGPFMTSHLAGGEGGIRHTIEHFADLPGQPWSRMTSPPVTSEIGQ